MKPKPEPTPLEDVWQNAWPEALALWSKFTKLSSPLWRYGVKASAAEGLTGSFAMIRLVDQAVVINLEEIAQRKLDRFALEILAHEIGHHVLCPGDLSDHARMLVRMRRALPTKEATAPMIQNLYADLLINDRLQRSAGLNMAGVYKALLVGEKTQSPLWKLYMRIYEILWSLPRRTLTRRAMEDFEEGDAHLAARLIRSYARDWMEGSGKFAALCLPYLLKEDQPQDPETALRGWADTPNAAQGADVPAGLIEKENDPESIQHPGLDPRIVGDVEGDKSEFNPDSAGLSQGQYRQPFEFGQILKALGLKFSDADVAIRYYREMALPHLVPFPVRILPKSEEPLHEGYEPWDIGSPIEAIDWLATVMQSPIIIPGLTTVQRTWGVMEGADVKAEPVDLDLYIDCSGSMPNPRSQLSYLALAGTILALSALRAGAKVQATLWSGTNQFDTTGDFVRDETHILSVVTGFIGGSTAFPLHIMRETYARRNPMARPAHILIISDDGLSTLYDKDERNTPGTVIAAKALEVARGGGTFVLQLYHQAEQYAFCKVAVTQGWNVRRIVGWDDLIGFAREFSRSAYHKEVPVERR